MDKDSSTVELTRGTWETHGGPWTWMVVLEVRRKATRGGALTRSLTFVQ